MKTVQIEKRAVTPSKIVCVGRNYVEHITELGNEVPDEMVVFCKPNSAISDVLYAELQEPLHYEAEICFIINDGALAAVGCGIDLTKRQLQSSLKGKGLPWERAKAFDGAALFGPFVPLPENSSELFVELNINGELRQRGSTSMMMYNPERILSVLKTFMTLEDGDIIMTGTPAGVGQIVAGDNFECSIVHGGKVITRASWKAI